METYDVVVVGSGTSGQTAAFHLNEKGLNVAVIEKADRPGGICALAGCQPKKWFYEATETIARGRHLEGKGIVSVPGCGTLQTQYLKSFGYIDHDVGNYAGVVSEVNPKLPKYPLFG